MIKFIILLFCNSILFTFNIWQCLVNVLCSVPAIDFHRSKVLESAHRSYESCYNVFHSADAAFLLPRYAGCYVDSFIYDTIARKHPAYCLVFIPPQALECTHWGGKGSVKPFGQLQHPLHLPAVQSGWRKCIVAFAVLLNDVTLHFRTK